MDEDTQDEAQDRKTNQQTNHPKRDNLKLLSILMKF